MFLFWLYMSPRTHVLSHLFSCSTPVLPPSLSRSCSYANRSTAHTHVHMHTHIHTHTRGIFFLNDRYRSFLPADISLSLFSFCECPLDHPLPPLYFYTNIYTRDKCTHTHIHSSPERRHTRDSTQRQHVHQSEARLGCC